MKGRRALLSAPLVVVVAWIVLWSAVVPAARAEDYTVGPGDVLSITVYGQGDLSKDYPVDPEGTIAFPLIGRIRAGGQTVRQLGARITALLEKDYLVNPQVLVSVKEYQSQKIHVLGEVANPGVYYLKPQTTLLDILARAGGFGKGGGNQVIVYRNVHAAASAATTGNSILRLSLDKIQRGDITDNIPLQDGDTVFVPKARAFFVLGEVHKPGTFPIESEMTAVDAVRQAGWFTEKAAPSAVKLTRSTDGRQETISLDLSSPTAKDAKFVLRDGDTLLVPRGNTFFVFGEVRNPGAYQLTRETNILEGITLAGGFSDKAAPGRTRVIRMTAKGPQVLHVDMNDVIKRGQRDKAIALQENDVVVVPESLF
jgi:polysaccharide export outer membrane protein